MSEVKGDAALRRASRWQAPAVGAASSVRAPSPAELREIGQRAYEEGFARGQAEGLESGRAQVEGVHAALSQIVEALQEPLQAVDERVIERLAQLALQIARRIIRRELRADPAEVVGVVREALAILPLGLRGIRIHLHPDDARLVADKLTPAEGESAWQIVEDPVIERGGCRISSDSSQVDATVDKRLARIVNAMFGSERDTDRGGDR